VRWNGDTFDDDQYSQGTLAAKPASDSFFIGVGVRHAAAGTASYYLYYTANTQTFFGKLITGTFTAFGAVMGGRTAGEVLRIEAEGTTIRAKVDGATQRTQTDSSLTTGAAGLTGYDTSTTLRLDDWEAGNVTPDPTPTYVASGAMVVTATNNATMAPQAPASRAAGDILVLVAHTSGNGDFNDTITNWTKLPSGTETNGANQKVECWWRVADGTASDNATVGGVADTNIRGARIFAVRNAANQAPTVARSNNAASATVTFPAADATSTTTLSVLAYCYEDDPTAIGTVSGFSAFDPDTSATGTDMAIGTDAYRANTTSGSKAGGTATVSGGTFANSVNVGLHFIFEPISTTATGTAAITLPALTATGSGTHTAPTYTGSATITLPALTATGTGTASGPTATGSATPSLPVMTATGDGTFTAPVYTGSAALTLPALTASGTGTHPFIGTATPSLPALTAEGTGTHTAPTYTGSAAVSLPALTADGAGTFTVPTYTGTAAVNLPALTADAHGPGLYRECRHHPPRADGQRGGDANDRVPGRRGGDAPRAHGQRHRHLRRADLYRECDHHAPRPHRHRRRHLRLGGLQRHGGGESARAHGHRHRRAHRADLHRGWRGHAPGRDRRQHRHLHRTGLHGHGGADAAGADRDGERRIHRADLRRRGGHHLARAHRGGGGDGERPAVHGERGGDAAGPGRRGGGDLLGDAAHPHPQSGCGVVGRAGGDVGRGRYRRMGQRQAREVGRWLAWRDCSSRRATITARY
jgi:hypothetical protein